MNNDRKRLNWMIEREAYVTENLSVPRWSVYTSQAALEQIGCGATPRKAIDSAMRKETDSYDV